MISLTSATKRAEEFAAALDGRAAGKEVRPELEALLEVATALQAAPAPEARPAFVADLRERLLLEAETALVRDASLTLPARRTGRRERRLAVAASAFVLVGGTPGMAAASQHALPGEALYPIKRGLETAQADLSTGRADKGRELLGQADTRLAELQSLLADVPASPEAGATLDAFVSQGPEGSQLLLDAFGDQQDPAQVQAVRDFTADAMDTLSALSDVAPAGLQDQLTAAAGTLKQIDDDAAAACSTCAALRPALQLPASFTGAAEAQRALRALQVTKVNNDHPTIGGIKQPTVGDQGTRDQQGSTTGSATGTTDGSGTSGTSDPGSALPDLGDTVDSVTGGGSGNTSGSGDGGLVDKTTKGVKDSVKNVLPGDDLDTTLDQLRP